MVEWGRHAQIQKLEAQGWKEDTECNELGNLTREYIGGPTFMKAPDGKIYAVSCGTETPVTRDFGPIKYMDGKRQSP